MVYWVSLECYVIEVMWIFGLKGYLFVLYNLITFLYYENYNRYKKMCILNSKEYVTHCDVTKGK